MVEQIGAWLNFYIKLLFNQVQTNFLHNDNQIHNIHRTLKHPFTMKYHVSEILVYQ